MKIEDIIYDTTRELLNVEDKIRITNIFIFCERQGVERFSELLYCDDHNKFIEELNTEYSNYEVDFSIDFTNANIKNAFRLTLNKIKEKFDADGFYKALYEGDEFALAIRDILNFEFVKPYA